LPDRIERGERAFGQRKRAGGETRPPFGILATKKQRDIFEASMQTVLDTEAGDRDPAGKARGDRELAEGRPSATGCATTWEASENYRRSGKIAEAIKSWDRLIEHYGEQLLALARNIKNVAVSFAGAAGGARAAFGDRAQAFAELRMGADSLDRTAVQLDSLTRTMAMYAANSPTRTCSSPSCRSRGSWDGSTSWPCSTTGTRCPPRRRWRRTRAAVVAKKLTISMRAPPPRSRTWP
jgi:hypothetical protein